MEQAGSHLAHLFSTEYSSDEHFLHSTPLINSWRSSQILHLTAEAHDLQLATASEQFEQIDPLTY